MGVSENKTYERYVVYPNESIDKLTVNRFLQRIFEDIESKMSLSSLSIRKATEDVYGTIRFSSADNFIFSSDFVTPSNSADYYNHVITNQILDDFSKSMSDTASSSTFFAPSSDGHGEISSSNYWIKSSCSEVDFNYLPNGVKCITGTFELGFNDIITIFDGNGDPLSGNISYPSEVSGYDTYIRVGDEDIMNINDYVKYSKYDDREDVEFLKKMDGTKVSHPFMEKCEATLKHNVCSWNTYSSFKQSFVELHYSSSIDLKKIFDRKYGSDGFSLYSNGKKSEESTIYTMHLRHPSFVFEQTPMVMMQIGFYNNDSSKKPVFGFDNRNSNETVKISDFDDHDTISESPLTEGNGDISPVNGIVMVKDIENEYNDDGLVVNNIIHFDVVMKFMVGSAADPKMIHGLKTINSKSKMQFVIIGI